MIFELISTAFMNLVQAYRDRVQGDSGTVVNSSLTQDAILFYKRNNLYDSIKFGWMSGAGSRKRTSTIYKFFTKLYTMVNPTPVYGSELVVNGGFDTDSIWSKGAGVTISGGTANFSGLAGDTQQIILVSGKTYKYSFEIKNYVSGTITLYFGTTTTGVKNSNGVYSGTIISNGTNIDFFTTNFIGSIDNVSVQEVLNSVYTVTDATQTTESSQPRVTGNIAPGDVEALQNQNGESRYLTHPTISFAANEAWSVTSVLFNNGSSDNDVSIFGSTDNSKSIFYIKRNGNNKFRILNESISGVDFTDNGALKTIGKYNVITFVADGLGNLSLYLNGIFVETKSVSTIFVFSIFLRGWTTGVNFNGELKAHIIRNVALTASEVLTEATFLRSKYPEIPSVQIGSQTWALRNLDMVATPQGNVIANVTDNSAWAASQTTYDTVYAATSGTDEQKTYAAVKAAAMWKFHGDPQSVDNGSWAGKIYNKFAVRLLKDDIDAYNTANPTTPWGWNIPSRAQLTTLSAIGGNAAKLAGTSYWTTANGTNIQGLSMLGAGYVNSSGISTGLKDSSGIHCHDANFVRVVKDADNTFDEVAITVEGYSIRLLKN